MSVYYHTVDDFLHDFQKPGNAKWCEDDNHCAKMQCAFYDAAQVTPGTPYDASEMEFIDPEITSCQGLVRDWIDAKTTNQNMRSDGFDNIFKTNGILTSRADGYFYNSVNDFVNGDRTMPGVYRQCLYDGNCTEAECVTYDAPEVVPEQRYNASVPSTTSVVCDTENTELTDLMSRRTMTDGKMQLEGVGPIHGGYAEDPPVDRYRRPQKCMWRGFGDTFNHHTSKNMGFEHRPIFVRKKDSNQYGWYWHTHGKEYPPTSTNSTEACSPELRDNCKYQAQVFWCQQGDSSRYSEQQEQGDADSNNLMLGRDVLKVEDSENWYPPWVCSWCK